MQLCNSAVRPSLHYRCLQDRSWMACDLLDSVVYCAPKFSQKFHPPELRPDKQKQARGDVVDGVKRGVYNTDTISDTLMKIVRTQ